MKGILFIKIFSFVFALAFFMMAIRIYYTPKGETLAVVYTLYGTLCLLTGFRKLKNHPWLYFIFAMAALSGGILNWPEIQRGFEAVLSEQNPSNTIWPSMQLFICSLVSLSLGIFTLRRWE